MKVSVVITCLNEENNIYSCLESLVNQSYPQDNYEIIVVDGNSKDKTCEIVHKFCMKHSNIRLITELKKGTAAGRNRGVKESVFDYIAFIDADCVAPSDWLAILVNGYTEAKEQDPLVVGVGGANIPPENTDAFLKAIGVAIDSYLGSFNSVQGRRFSKDLYVSSIATLNALFEKSKIIEIGYYDDSLASEAEDAELNYRLVHAGYRLFYIQNSFVWHNMRPTPKTWFKNMFRYGKGRARLLKRYPEMWQFQYLLPLFFVAAMVLILFAPFYKILWVSVFYFPSIFFYTSFQCIKNDAFPLIPKVMLVYIIQHFGYGLGQTYGLLSPNIS